MSGPFDLEFELQHQAQSLRKLAQDLLRDPGRADDLVQDTLHRSLQTPPQRGGPTEGWFRTVMRRLALQHTRSDRRRQRRELVAARPDAVPGTAELLARREILRRVTDAVLALDEPYQTTVFLRYFEDLPPRVIARRTGTPLATVKSRLQRGLHLLRARLDAQTGGDRSRWTQALTCAFGLHTMAVATWITTGALLMGQGTKLVVGAAGVAAAAFLVWAFAGRDIDAGQAAAAADRDHGQVAVAAAGAEAPATDRNREAVATPTEAPPDPLLAHPYAYSAEILVLDSDGLPLADEDVRAAPAECAENEVAKSGPDGIARFSWHGRAASMVLDLQFHGGLHRCLVQAGVPLRLALCRPNQGPNLRLSLATSDNGDAVFAVTSLHFEGAEGAVHLIAGNEDTAKPKAQTRLHPFAIFADQLLRAPENPTVHNSLVADYSEVFTKAALHLSGLQVQRVFSTRLEAVAPADDKATLTGVVLGEDGKPMRFATVALGTEVDRPTARTRTDDHGAFQLGDLAEGWYEVRAGGRDGGLVRTRMFLAKGTTSAWTAHLERGLTIRGRAVDAKNQPLKNWRVEWTADSTSWADVARVHDDGTWELPNLPGGTGTLRLRHADDDVQLPMLVQTNVAPGDTDVVLRFDAEACSGRLQVAPIPPANVTGAAAEVRLWQEESGEGATLARDEKAGVFQIDHLPPGWYRLAIGCTSVGWMEAGRHWIDGKGTVELGQVPLPLAGSVQFVQDEGHLPPPDQRVRELYKKRGDLDVRAENAAAAMQPECQLPAGEWLCLWRDADLKLRVHTFTVQAGQSTTVTLR